MLLFLFAGPFPRRGGLVFTAGIATGDVVSAIQGQKVTFSVTRPSFLRIFLLPGLPVTGIIIRDHLWLRLPGTGYSRPSFFMR